MRSPLRITTGILSNVNVRMILRACGYKCLHCINEQDIYFFKKKTKKKTLLTGIVYHVKSKQSKAYKFGSKRIA